MDTIGQQRRPRRHRAGIATIAAAGVLVTWASVTAGVPAASANGAGLACSDYSGTGYTAAETASSSGVCEITFAGAATNKNYTLSGPEGSGLEGIATFDVIAVAGGGAGATGFTASLPTRIAAGGGGAGGGVSSGTLTVGNATQARIRVGGPGLPSASNSQGGTGDYSEFSLNNEEDVSGVFAGYGDGGRNPIYLSEGDPSGGSSASLFLGGLTYYPPDFNTGGRGGTVFGGGGAGAGANGANSTASGPGAGGAGKTVAAFGLFTSAMGPYSGGGGGGAVDGTGAAGADGGGAGANGTAGALTGADADQAVAGAGGGGGSPDTAVNGLSGAGGKGSPGVVIVRFLLPYEVTYDANEADSGTVPSVVKVAPNGTFTPSGNTGSLVKSGFEFAGWNTAPNGSGTNYASGVSTASPSSSVTLYAKWVKPAPPAPNNGGGGSSTPEPSPSPAASAPASPTAPATPVVGPVTPGSNPNIPAGGVPLGGSVFLVNGQPVPVTVRPDSPTGATGLEITGDGFTMRLIGRTANGKPLGLTPDGALILEQDRTAYTEGTGFQPNSEVTLYVFSEPRFLGTVMTDANGSFRGSVPLPLDIKAGRHTLQSNGLAPDGAVRSLSLGVQVQARATQPTQRTARATVYFDVLSAKLDAADKKALRALAAKRAKETTRVVSIGFVQPSDTTRNDMSLSLQRAKAVTSYLKSIGVKGVVVTRGGGIAKEAGAAGRKATVTLTYRK